MPSDPVTLNDLFVRRIKTDDIGPYREHDGFQITEAQLIQVLEGMGAKRVQIYSDHTYELDDFFHSLPLGSALVLPVPTPKEEG